MSRKDKQFKQQPEEMVSGLNFWAKPGEYNLIKNKKVDAVKVIREDRD